MVIWITGRKGSGKTTTAKRIGRQITNGVVIDGEQVRAMANNTDYTDDGRHRNITDIALIAAMLEQSGLVPIVACISPKKEWRMYARRMFRESVLIYRPGGTLWEGTTYEEPDAEEMRL